MGWLRRETDEPIEGHVQTSLEATIIRACNRLDKILDDETRWKLPQHDAHLFAAQNADLNNGIVQAELKKRTEEREAVLAKIAHIGALLRPTQAQPIAPAPKTNKPQRKKKSQ
jgi:hypothetical protein